MSCVKPLAGAISVGWHLGAANLVKCCNLTPLPSAPPQLLVLPCALGQNTWGGKMGSQIFLVLRVSANWVLLGWPLAGLLKICSYPKAYRSQDVCSKQYIFYLPNLFPTYLCAAAVEKPIDNSSVLERIIEWCILFWFWSGIQYFPPYCVGNWLCSMFLPKI